MQQLALDITNPVFVKGFLAFAAMVVVFVGSAWLLLSMILGVKLGYFVMATCFFAVMILTSAIWFVTGLGPKGADGFIGDLGRETAWQQVSAGPDLTSAKSEYGTFDVSDYPDGEGWVTPGRNRKLADLSGEESTADEVDNAKPVMDSLILSAVSPIPGTREEAAEHLQGEVKLDGENFEIADIKMKEADVQGKTSILAVGRAVPSQQLTGGDLGGAEEGTVTKHVAELKTQLKPGDPVMEIRVKGGRRLTLNADKPGRLVQYGFREGDKIKPNVPFATVDVSGQPGAPEPVEVAAVRVLGSEKVPAFIYLAVSTVLFLLHLMGLSRLEKQQKTPVPQPAST